MGFFNADFAVTKGCLEVAPAVFMFKQRFGAQNQNATISTMQRTGLNQAEMRVHPTPHWAILDLPEKVVIAWAWFQHDIGVGVA